jgi:integrase
MAAGEAKRKLRELIESLTAAVDSGAERGGGGTVADAVAVFLERDLPARRRGGRPLAPASITGYRWACAHISGRLGWVRLGDLSVELVEQFYDAIAAAGDGPTTASSLRKVRTTLHQVVEVAVRRGWISRNVAATAVLPAAAEAEPRKALTPNEARKLLAQLRQEPYGLMFALSLRLGLRPGEAAAIAWGDSEGSTLHVRRGRRAVGGKMEVANELKTAASRRTIELPADIVEWVAEHRGATFGDVLALPEEAKRRAALLMFPSTRGQVLDPSNMLRELSAICERAGVPAIRPNELRHSCASLLSDEGVPNEQIADLLGHTTTRMVDQTYRHRLRPTVDVAARASWASETG